jgi:hypothetical protein
MNATVEVALIVALSSVIGPVILTSVQSGQRRRELKDQIKREDEKAKAAAEVADTLVKSNKEIANKVEQNHQTTSDKLEVIRVDVNSNMTAAMKGELDATQREHATLIELVDLRKKLGQEPTKVVLEAIDRSSLRMAELTAVLSDRLKATEKVAAKTGE